MSIDLAFATGAPGSPHEVYDLEEILGVLAGLDTSATLQPAAYDPAGGRLILIGSTITGHAAKLLGPAWDSASLRPGMALLEGLLDGVGTPRGGHELVALAARHLLSDGEPWNQDGYDALTLPWRQTYGPVHPHDAAAGCVRPRPAAPRAERRNLA